MNKKEFSEKTSKIIGTTKITPVSIEYKDDEYELRPYSDRYATETGWVIIAQLIPKDSLLPKFVFRWDHGEGVVDIDIILNGEHRKDLDNLGYSGHHAVLVNPDSREYEANILIPNRKIFKGIIKVGLIQD